MTIATVGATFQLPACFGGGMGAYLTPDALMTYCETRLQGLDTQMNAAMVKQQQSNDDQTVLSTLAGNLPVRSDKLDLNDPGGFGVAKSYADQMMAAADQIKDPQAAQRLRDAANKIYTKLNIALQDMADGSSWGNDVGATVLGKDGKPMSDNHIDVTCLSDAQIKDLQSGGKYHNHDVKDGTNGNPDDKNFSVDELKADSTDAVANIQKDLNSGAELSMIGLQSLMSQRQEAIQMCTNLVQSLGDQCNKVVDNVGK